MMRESDVIVNCLPHTAMTTGFVDRAAIAAMKPSAVFVNVGRGKTVDEGALVEALREKRIRGAALDVAHTEPLPADSPLWGLDNLVLTPHCADKTRVMVRLSVGGTDDLLRRYLSALRRRLWLTSRADFL